jgi:hypothetical protein
MWVVLVFGALALIVYFFTKSDDAIRKSFDDQHREDQRIVNPVMQAHFDEAREHKKDQKPISQEAIDRLVKELGLESDD